MDETGDALYAWLYQGSGGEGRYARLPRRTYQADDGDRDRVHQW
jgi:hypothetical protein